MDGDERLCRLKKSKGKDETKVEQRTGGSEIYIRTTTRRLFSIILVQY